MKRITGKIVKHQDGREAYVLSRSKRAPYFEVIVLGAGREQWSAADMDGHSLMHALGLNKKDVVKEGGDDGPVQEKVPSP